MPETPEPFEILRDAWRGLEPPDPSEAELDERTRAVLDWTRAAWAALEPAEVGPPGRLVLRVIGRGWGPLARLAAAAVLIAALALALRWSLSGDASRVPREAPSVAAEHAPEPSRTTTALAALERPDGTIEMRRGPVRLLLLTPDTLPLDAGRGTR